MKKLAVKIAKNKFLWIGVLFSLFLLIFLASAAFRGKQRARGFITYQVERQDLVISVIEGGNLKALRSQNIINEVPGQRAILEIVDEGVRITDEDVKNGKVLIKLDSKDLKERSEQLGIDAESGWASFLEAQENLEIQKEENKSNIRQAELKVRFAGMDLEKYLGEKLGGEIVEKERLNYSKLKEKDDSEKEEGDPQEGVGVAEEEAIQAEEKTGKTDSAGEEGGSFNYSELIEDSELGGEAVSKKTEIQSNIDLAKEEGARAEDKVEWSEKLAKEGYVTKSELSADMLSLKQKVISLERAQLARELFVKYDFPKRVEELISGYRESLSELGRTKAKAQSKIIQAEASVRSREVSYLQKKNSLGDTKEHLSKCIIKATQPGIVIYATSSRPFRSQEPMQPGTVIRQRQEMLSLPDFSTMGVEVRIHESAVEKVIAGQKVVVKVDAFPEKVFSGVVNKIAQMPDPTMKWMNPDIQVYVAEIALDESHDSLKPGMSAQVEIVVEELEDVLAIPLLAVSFGEKGPTCNILKKGKIITRDIELGASNEEMVETKKGLEKNEVVLFLPGGITYEVKKKPRAEQGKFEQKERTKNK